MEHFIDRQTGGDTAILIDFADRHSVGEGLMRRTNRKAAPHFGQSSFVPNRQRDPGKFRVNDKL
ncbi:MAG: hypothetical protein K2O18_10550 [Oscillospiraceae bacterium]|nr:hypothetical protein [Oscillospiraceae bacterium]